MAMARLAAFLLPPGAAPLARRQGLHPRRAGLLPQRPFTRIRQPAHPRASTAPSRADNPGVPGHLVPAAPRGSSAPLLPAFRTRRLATFCAMGFVYAWYVGLRSTFAFAAPGLGLPLRAVGAVASTFPAAYGLSRLFTGALVDTGSPRTVLLCGLALAGACVAAMGGAPAAAGPLGALWLLHGLVQGAGAGASAKLLTRWFGPRERGRWWALWATSANAGAFAAPLGVAFLQQTYGARVALAVPGVAAVAVAATAALVLVDSPARAGFSVPWATPSTPPSSDEGESSSSAGEGYWRTLGRTLASNRALWALAGAYFLVYLVRTGLKNWLHFFLVATRGIPPAEAAVRASAMELGGVAGTFGAGLVSDLAGGRRVAVTIAYLVVLAGAVAALAALPAGSAAVDAAAVALVGCAVNGPQMMIGLIGAEVTDPRVMATAAGLIGCISYAGAAAAGFPLSALVAARGWGAFFAALVAASAGAAVLLAPFWRLRADAGKEA